MRVTLITIATVVAQMALAQTSGSEHWVSTWATAETLVPRAPFSPPASRLSSTSNPALNGPNAPNTSPPAMQANGAPSRPPRGNGLPPIPSSFEDQTVRMVVHTTIGGKTVRIGVSNMLNSNPLDIGAAHIAFYKGASAIVPGSDHVLTFSGGRTFTVPSGALAISDPIDLTVLPQSDLAISLYLPHDTGGPTNHMLGLHTTYISKGDTTGSETMPEPSTNLSYFFLASVDVLAPKEAYSVVALGDSITDGFKTTPNTDRAWPTLLAKRLEANKMTRNVAVVNQGISGNQVLRDGAGVSALARFDRDVLGHPGVKWVILLEGINDINIRGRTEAPGSLTAEELINGYKQIIDRCHLKDIRVIGATIMPEEGVPTASERGEHIRQEVNSWIRAKGNFDAVVDFDKVVLDPQNPARLRPDFDPGDHIHPNDAGNQAMADAFNLSLFER